MPINTEWKESKFKYKIILIHKKEEKRAELTMCGPHVCVKARARSEMRCAVFA